ncbi:putative DNA-binding phosphoprotein [Sheeppox virus]|uniref:DNA-binding virion core protein n=1 Tax=Sheeppox virus TaxID=10266 RepID=A0A2P1A9E0_SHEV|nr:DNA-binding virion core protein [Sheeppox virus]QEJ79630.1 putative DNA-binding phosphoprotein [Sheeppox virus]QEJ79776.1 putative DNA-binding phosphoprotein [Sheeppox virus]
MAAYNSQYYANTPFYITTKEGKYLVLKAIKVCDIRTVECDGDKASCIFKVEKSNQTCDRQSSPCERAERSSSPNRGNNSVPFMRTNMLEDLQAKNRTVMSRILG